MVNLLLSWPSPWNKQRRKIKKQNSTTNAMTWWCPTYTMLCFSFIVRRLVYPMLPVSLDCPFLIASSVFFDVYLEWAIDRMIIGKRQIIISSAISYRVTFRWNDDDVCFAIIQNWVLILALAIGGEGCMLTMSQASRLDLWRILNERHVEFTDHFSYIIYGNIVVHVLK